MNQVLDFTSKVQQEKIIGQSLLALIYLAGLVGLVSPISEYFVLLTPLNLLITAGLLCYFHAGWTRKFLTFSFLIIITSFMIEALGVYTGKIFGSYQYGAPLGFKIFDVPLIIGVNWLILIYCAVHIISGWSIPAETKPILAGLFMVGFDLLLEPVAIHFDFWRWNHTNIPVQNYLAWFAISVVFASLYPDKEQLKNNPLALWVFLSQIVFFGLLNIFIRF